MSEPNYRMKTMPWGVHKSKSMIDIPIGYLLWMTDPRNLSDGVDIGSEPGVRIANTPSNKILRLCAHLEVAQRCRDANLS